MQHLDQAEMGEVSVERRGRPLAGLLGRVDRELDRHATRVAHTVLHPARELEVVAVAGGEVAAG
jgi:hypothetical protein